jgi:hypothetical protein
LRLLGESRISFFVSSACFEEVPLFFAVDAAAVRLPVHAGLLGNPDPFGPTFAEIAIEERNALVLGDFFGDLPYEIVLLVATVKEGGRERVKQALLRNPCGLGNTEQVTIPTTFFLPKGNLPQECLKRIGAILNYGEAFWGGISGQCIETSSILCIGVDIGIEEEATNLISLVPEYPQREDGAGAATHMQ